MRYNRRVCAAADARLLSEPVGPLPIERFRAVLDGEGYGELLALRERALDLLHERAVWCVNSTAQGGGVAEMLRSLLAYTRGAGVDTRWMFLRGDHAFFAVTKRLHNRLHGSPGDGGALGPAERADYEAVTAQGARELARMVRPRDVVILHDPQTAGMAPHLLDTGVQLVWRVHIGVDAPNRIARETWEFLTPYLTGVDAYVFSRERFIWDVLDPSRAVVVAPSIDVFSPKNQPLGEEAVPAILRVIGLLGPGDTGQALFVREDGTPGRVDRPARVVQQRPLRDGEPFAAQVSRWDRLKDPMGVLSGFTGHVAAAVPDAHLVLAGPAVEAVSDDPEGAAVLAEMTAAWHRLPLPIRERVHLVSLPMVDAEENGAMVNAIQSRADVILQKSLAEGFGLTVAEGMWKARPVVAGAVGGIQDQVVDGMTGLLVDPRDLRAFGDAVARLLTDRDLATRLGVAGHQRVRDGFLEPRHLRQWVELIERLRPAGSSASSSPRLRAPAPRTP